MSRDRMSLSVQRDEINMLQFSGPDRRWAVLLTEEVFALHTSSYVDNVDFIDRFNAALRAVLSVSALGITYMEAIGFRYINLVAPHPDETLDQYLRPWALPPQPVLEGEAVEIRQGLYVSVYKTSVGELRFQSLRNPPFVLPPDLQSGATQKNNWLFQPPEGDFAVIDIDHGCRFDPLESIDPNAICEHLSDLRGVSRKLFDQIGTDHAKKVWLGEQQ